MARRRPALRPAPLAALLAVLTVFAAAAASVPGRALVFQSDPDPLQPQDDLAAEIGALDAPDGRWAALPGAPAPPPPGVLQSVRAAARSTLGSLGVGAYRAAVVIAAPRAPPPLDLRQYTVWEILQWTLSHPPDHSAPGKPHGLPLVRLAKLVNLTAPVRDLLADPEADLTLFAPDDEAHAPFSQEPGHHPGPDDSLFSAALEAVAQGASEGGDGRDGEEWRKKYLRVVELVLRYHISPGQQSLDDILARSTLPTALRTAKDPGAPPFRLRVKAVRWAGGSPEVSLNVLTRIGGHGSRPVLAKNGIIHVARRTVLIPPLSPLTELFLFPNVFSTLTSAVQKVHLDRLLLPHFAHGDDARVEDTVQNMLASLLRETADKPRLEKRTFTVFAPANHAFRKLGTRANAFLFSPFGARVLRYILSYHIVPDVAWYTDHTDEDAASLAASDDADGPELDLLESLVEGRSSFPLVGGKPDIEHVELPTLLGARKNETLRLKVLQFPRSPWGSVVRKVFVEPGSRGKDPKAPFKPTRVVFRDWVAWGGVIHVVPKIIPPPAPEGHHAQEGDFAHAASLGLLA